MLVRINRIAKHVAKGARYFSTAPSSKTGVSCDLPAQSIDSIGCSPLVQQLVDSIEKLSLLETAALVRTLKTRLNLPDVSFASISSGMAQNSSAPGANSSGVAAATEPPAPTAPPKQTEFKVILQKVDPAAKAKIIREIKAILPGLNLVEAKTFVESVPKLVKEKLSSADAEKLKKTLEDLGASVSME